MLTVARTIDTFWRIVYGFLPEGCFLSPETFELDSLWKEDPPLRNETSAPPTLTSWKELLPPLPNVDVRCIGYTFTYPSHQREMRAADCFRFQKKGPARLMDGHLLYRPHLDYEAEVGILQRRHAPERFGFLMVNDLTDRGIQVINYSRKLERQQSVFSEAKNFEGALLVGPLLAIGDDEDWEKLSISLRVNQQPRQTLRAVDCILRPKEIHQQVFQEDSNTEWLLVASGTPEGVILTVPNKLRTMELFLKNGFSVKRARRAHLFSHTFLQPGDEIEMTSEVLGYGVVHVSNENKEATVKC